MSRNTGTKTKKCLVFQFYRIDNVYYFRFIKLIVSTFLVYKVCQYLLGIRWKTQTTVVRNKHIGWSLSARHTGTKGSSDGYR